MRREGEINVKKYVQSFTFDFSNYRKRGLMGKIGRTNILGKIILLHRMAARWHSATVEKGGRGGGGE
jgi:hypothetical protein